MMRSMVESSTLFKFLRSQKVIVHQVAFEERKLADNIVSEKHQ